MERHEFKTIVNASAEKVWSILWDDATYPQWTSVFSEGSRAETDWEEGSKVLFVNSKGQGMVSMIVEKKPNQFMSFKHLGTVDDGKEDLQSGPATEWAGALENYTLRPVNGKTELLVSMDITDDYKEYFSNTWPQALQKVKQLAE